MVVTKAAQRRLRTMLERSGTGQVGFRFDGAIGSCRMSKPILVPVREPMAEAREFPLADLVLYASGENADLLEVATIDYDGAWLFGQGLTVSWPHREGGCPNCR